MRMQTSEINYILTAVLCHRRAVGHVSRVTSVKTSVTINLRLNAGLGQAAV
jgi:hypothetical protein